MASRLSESSASKMVSVNGAGPHAIDCNTSGGRFRLLHLSACDVVRVARAKGYIEGAVLPDRWGPIALNLNNTGIILNPVLPDNGFFTPLQEPGHGVQFDAVKLAQLQVA